MASENKKRPAVEVPLVENLHAPEVFAHATPNFTIGNGVVTVTLASMRWDHSTKPPTQHIVVVGRVTMPVTAARGLASGLHDFLEQHGVHAVTDDDKKHMQ